ncbi:uncharacterized protein LOC108681095 isoform X2 [Hyalella azteca]|uniref:Uncharacterized protein LOC108681095 isoform X2 n=1 Tax=Hyalella azteca TaxID=294128 RepID=A0A8B7PJN4_HYAAZ|nr:uncharacterized protein LOC108681095 isoform X2 [Hyalella azteca]
MIVFYMIVSFLSSGSHALNSDDDFVHNYAVNQMWRDCLGDDLSFAWSRKVELLTLACSRRLPKVPSSSTQTGRTPRQRQASVTSELGLTASQLFVTNPPELTHHRSSSGLQTIQHHPSILSSSVKTHPDLSINAIQPIWFTLFDQIPIFVHPVDGENILRSRQRRQIRQEDKDDAFRAFVQNMLDRERRVKEQLDNHTCVLEALGVINEDGELRFDVIKENTSRANLPPEVKEDFIRALDECHRVTGCETFIPHLASTNIQRVLSFMQCTRNRQQMACIKAGLKSFIQDNIAQKTGSRVIDLDAMVNRIYYINQVTALDGDINNMFFP